MARTPEGKVKKHVKDIIRCLDGWFFMPVQTGRGIAGVPDILACVGGAFVGIETKAGNNRPTTLQALRLNEIILSGGYGVVVNEEKLEVLELWLREVKRYGRAEPPSSLVDPIFEVLRLARQGRKKPV